MEINMNRKLILINMILIFSLICCSKKQDEKKKNVVSVVKSPKKKNNKNIQEKIVEFLGKKPDYVVYGDLGEMPLDVFKYINNIKKFNEKAKGLCGLKYLSSANKFVYFGFNKGSEKVKKNPNSKISLEDSEYLVVKGNNIQDIKKCLKLSSKGKFIKKNGVNVHIEDSVKTYFPDKNTYVKIVNNLNTKIKVNKGLWGRGDLSGFKFKKNIVEIDFVDYKDLPFKSIVGKIDLNFGVNGNLLFGLKKGQSSDQILPIYKQVTSIIDDSYPNLKEIHNSIKIKKMDSSNIEVSIQINEIELKKYKNITDLTVAILCSGLNKTNKCTFYKNISKIDNKFKGKNSPQMVEVLNNMSEVSKKELGNEPQFSIFVDIPSLIKSPIMRLKGPFIQAFLKGAKDKKMANCFFVEFLKGKNIGYMVDLKKGELESMYVVSNGINPKKLLRACLPKEIIDFDSLKKRGNKFYTGKKTDGYFVFPNDKSVVFVMGKWANKLNIEKSILGKGDIEKIIGNKGIIFKFKNIDDENMAFQGLKGIISFKNGFHVDISSIIINKPHFKIDIVPKGIVSNEVADEILKRITRVGKRLPRLKHYLSKIKVNSINNKFILKIDHSKNQTNLINIWFELIEFGWKLGWI
jgi:hypothetical protein